MYIPGFLLEADDLRVLTQYGIIKGERIFKNPIADIKYYVLNKQGFNDFINLVRGNKFFSKRESREVEFIIRNSVLIFTSIVNKKDTLLILMTINTLYNIAPEEATILSRMLKAEE